jgi:hypothetical protein
MSTLELTGLDGANPLAFLAALGTLRLADLLHPGHARLRWTRRGKWTPRLELPDPVTQDTFLRRVHEQLAALEFPTKSGHGVKV